MSSSLHLRLCLYVLGQVLGSLCVCTYKCTRHTFWGVLNVGANFHVSTSYLLMGWLGLQTFSQCIQPWGGFQDSNSGGQTCTARTLSNLIWGVHFKHGPLGLACRHSKSWCMWEYVRVCAFLLNSYLVKYHQPFLVKVKHKMNYVVCDNLFIEGFFSCFMWMFENHWTKSLMQ